MIRDILSTDGITDLKLIKTQPFIDNRGSFLKAFDQSIVKGTGWSGDIGQINISSTCSVGAVRGMHFQQPPECEFKMVTCIHGSVWDVALDIRKNSPTFMKWYGCELSSENNLSLLIPPGFAHGFQVLQENSMILYIHSNAYHPVYDDGINPLDPVPGIDWPLAISSISEKDSLRAPISDDFAGLEL